MISNALQLSKTNTLRVPHVKFLVSDLAQRHRDLRRYLALRDDVILHPPTRQVTLQNVNVRVKREVDAHEHVGHSGEDLVQGRRRVELGQGNRNLKVSKGGSTSHICFGKAHAGSTQREKLPEVVDRRCCLCGSWVAISVTVGARLFYGRKKRRSAHDRSPEPVVVRN